MANDKRLVTVDTFMQQYEADLAKVFLESAGVEVFLVDYNTVAIDWALSNAIGDIKLQVGAEDVDRARALLAEHRPKVDFWSDKLPSDFEDDVCLGCGEPLPAEQDACSACGWTFAAGASEPGPNEGELE